MGPGNAGDDGSSEGGRANVPNFSLSLYLKISHLILNLMSGRSAQVFCLPSHVLCQHGGATCNNKFSMFTPLPSQTGKHFLTKVENREMTQNLVTKMFMKRVSWN